MSKNEDGFKFVRPEDAFVDDVFHVAKFMDNSCREYLRRLTPEEGIACRDLLHESAQAMQAMAEQKMFKIQVRDCFERFMGRVTSLNADEARELGVTMVAAVSAGGIRALLLTVLEPKKG